MYLEKFREARRVFLDEYQCNLVTAFAELQDRGCLELITSCATHGYLPLMEICREAVRAQIKIAVDYYRKRFNRDSPGFWLPECGFNPGDDEHLKQEGIRYFILDSHGVLFASPQPKYGVFAPVYCLSLIHISNWYINVDRPNRSYCAELGLMGPDGRFVCLSRSNTCLLYTSRCV